MNDLIFAAMDSKTVEKSFSMFSILWSAFKWPLLVLLIVTVVRGFAGPLLKALSRLFK